MGDYNLTVANYYYRLKEVRKACLRNIPEQSITQSIVPVSENLIASNTNAAIEILVGEFRISVSDTVTPDLLKMVMQVVPMLNDAVCFKSIYIVTGYTDLRF